MDHLDQLLWAIGRYALEMGEDWRLHEGAEIMDAYCALSDSIHAMHFHIEGTRKKIVEQK